MIIVILIVCIIILIIIGTNIRCENFSTIEKPYLWVYWENKDGKPTPPIIEICLEIMIKR